MISKQTVVTNKTGLHARPASVFVQAAQQYRSKITLRVNGKDYNAKSILNVLAACAKCGTPIELFAEGEDEEAAVAGLASAIESGLGE